LQGARRHLVAATAAAAADPARDATHRLLATNALVDFARDQPETLARALVVSDERQYPILLEAVRKHPSEALAELERQFVARPERVWPDEVDVSKFSDPARDLVAKIENAGGLVDRHFALCQSLPLADFAELSESLRAAGYRPTRLRPYSAPLAAIAERGAGNGGQPSVLLCAVVWQRDGRRWQSHVGMTAETISAIDQESANRGLEPIDIAGYLDGDEVRYAAIWVSPSDSAAHREPGQRPTLEIGLTRQEFKAKAKGDLTPAVLQLVNRAGYAAPSVAVIWRPKRSILDTWTIGSEGRVAQTAAMFADREAADIAVFRAESRNGKQAAAEAIDDLTVQLAQKPDEPMLLRARGMAAVKLASDEQAVEDLTRFLGKSAGDVPAWHSLAVAQARLGNRQAATSSLEEITKRAGDSFQTTYSRSVVRAILGSDTEALAAIEEAVTRHVNDSALLYHAACAYALVAEYLETKIPLLPTPLTASEAREERLKTDGGPQDADRAQRIAQYKERAIELLERACDFGYCDGEHMSTLSDIESLWLLDRFQKVLARLGADRRFAAVWTRTTTANGNAADGSQTATGTPQVESVVCHGLGAEAHLARCRQLIGAGYRIRSLSARPMPTGREAASASAGQTEGIGSNDQAVDSGKDSRSVALVTASTWLRPGVSESVLDESARQNARAAVAMLQLGERDRAWEILQHVGDPRRRSYWLSDVSPMRLEAELLADRLLHTADPREKFALLQALGEYPPATLPSPLSGNGSGAGTPSHWLERVVDHATQLYRDSRRRDLHAAARWLLLQWGEQSTVNEIDSRRMPSQGPDDAYEWFTNAHRMTMVVVPAGEYWMGSPPSEPERDLDEMRQLVRITRPFAISDREVNIELFYKFYQEVFRDTNTSYLERYSPRRDNGPMVLESWFAALAFCRWLSDREGFDPDKNCLPPLEQIVAAAHQADAAQPVTLELPYDFLSRPGYRLPTEAEWEYACRAGTVTRYNFGNDRQLLGRYGWFIENSGNRTRPRGQLRPNDWGLFDMHGNVWEWCLDWWSDSISLDRITDPAGPPVGQGRLVRGGGWSLTSRNCRSALRVSSPPNYRSTSYGFRVVLAW
jgi:hypothetical protein